MLYRPTGGRDGGFPSGLTFDPAGNLYTSMEYNAGVVKLVPSNGGWQETLSCWIPNADGGISGVILDAAGNLYGVAVGDGAYGQGSVFQLTGPVCTENVLYSFQAVVTG